MEAAPGATAAVRNGGVTLPSMPPSSSQPSRKQWRAVTEQSARNSSNEEMERSKLGPSDERLIYEHGREPLDVDFCSINIDGGLDSDILQQRLHTVVKQREELQQIEVDLRAQVIAKSEIVGLRNTIEAEIKEHANAIHNFQEQLHEKEEKIRELERKLDEKERELHASRLEKDAQVWAKEDLIRERNQELQSYRRERDTSEAERAQHIKQIHDLREHLQEKERQFVELQEQHRIAQEAILYKDEQMREAQAWMARAQEMDALQSTTNHNLQAELRDRTEQYNQLWLGCQRQFAEMEKLHMHIQQLQAELVDVREKSGIQLDDSHGSHTNSNDVSQVAHANGNQLEVNDSNSPQPTTGMQNGNAETSSGNALTQTDHVHSVAFAPSSLFGVPTYLPTAMHPFVMHQQGVPHPSHVTQSPFHQLPAMSSIQNWQNQQPPSDGEHTTTQNQYSEQTGENLLRMEPHYNFEVSGSGQAIHANYIDASINPVKDMGGLVGLSNGEGQVLKSIDENHENAQTQQNLQQISSQFDDALRLDAIEHGNDSEENKAHPVGIHGLENKTTPMEQTGFSINTFSSEAPAPAIIFSESSETASNAVLTSAFISTAQRNFNVVGKAGETYLLDERALLASIARAIGSGGRIRISSTLPNRLGKMLAPLHWHDYKRTYGKLDEFVANHPDLFLVEGDYVQLREGAQGTIAAKAAVAKVAAAAAAAMPTLFSSSMASVALTPLAQSHRLKKVSSLDSASVNSDKASYNELAVPRSSNSVSHPSFLEIQNQNFSGDPFRVAGGIPNVKILSKTKDVAESNGTEARPSRTSMLTVGNGVNTNRNEFSQSKGPSHGRHGSNLVGKQQSRSLGAASSQRR
ncbi:uncharacterized protein LOC127259233 isoform X2 [Andrographis paniculata]|uniref:uncharacterized protein LOC127259233 isoform X2 n=1 Tax=Andrographis paniculata TaxID=175694 RepID=UPI0021E8A31D|nr:uncharacterized protein LOC127259233 isoform X2 [Andrographis paniculata]